MWICKCDDCEVKFMNEDKDCAYCDACWAIREKIEEEVEQIERCDCLFGCDYCLAVEPRIGRD